MGNVCAVADGTLPFRAIVRYLAVPVGGTIDITSTAQVCADTNKFIHLIRRTLRFARTVRAALGMAVGIGPRREWTGEVVALEAAA
jgi:hypothetical protein